MADDPYLRVYRRIVDDPRFARVYPDDRALAIWLRLSMEADAAWPSSASLPYGTTKATLALLEEVGLIVRQAGNRYRVPDLDEERDKRRQSASSAAASRWNDAGASPEHVQPQSEGTAEAMPTRTEPNRPEPSRADPRRRETNRVPSTSGDHAREADPSRDPRLTKEQADAWNGFDRPEWEALKREWLARGFRWPPLGDSDEEGTQRNVLWPIVEARPSDVAMWVREAKGKGTHEVVASVLRRWHAVKHMNGMAP